MIEINLLPWRAHARAAQVKNKRRLLFLLLILLVGCGLFFYSHKSFFSQPIVPAQKTSQAILPVSFRWKGFLQDEERTWALIILTDGRLVGIRKGEMIDDQWRLISVDDNQLMIENLEHKNFSIKR